MALVDDPIDHFGDLIQQVLQVARFGVSRIEFLRRISDMFMDSLGCDAVEVRLSNGEISYRWRASRKPEVCSRFELESARGDDQPDDPTDPALERLCRNMLHGQFDPEPPYFTPAGSFWTTDAANAAPLMAPGDTPNGQVADTAQRYRSLAILPFRVDGHAPGLLLLKFVERDAFGDMEVRMYERIAATLGLAIGNRRAQARLRERVKELTCLYGIAHVVQQDLPLEQRLQRIVELLPPGWQYPDIAEARIVVDGQEYATAGFRKGMYKQVAEIRIDGRPRGSVELIYTRVKPEFAEGPFLKEEESLIESIAQDIAQLVRSVEAQDERARLQAQLQHADRLATIGQLASGVAHELNEPLANILGFAQLMQKSGDLPADTSADAQKIVDAALHARTVIQKMLLFARKSPPKREPVSLNEVVRDGLYFVEARCVKHGIELVSDLAPDLPNITADVAQLHQVLMNLTVNAIQAMPDGGTLTVRTRAGTDHAALVVEDTGVGMTEAVRNRLFDPFFTTKDVGEGTGLGLSVVHGIVTAHGGSISVESEPGRGSRFEVRLPLDGGSLERKAEQV